MTRFASVAREPVQTMISFMARSTTLTSQLGHNTLGFGEISAPRLAGDRWVHLAWDRRWDVDARPGVPTGAAESNIEPGTHQHVRGESAARSGRATFPPESVS